MPNAVWRILAPRTPDPLNFKNKSRTLSLGFAESDTPAHHMKPLFPALSLALLGSILLLFAIARPKPDQAVIVLFSSAVHSDEALSSVIAAGLLPLRPVKMPWSKINAVLAYPGSLAGTRSGQSARASLPARLPRGAWLMIDADGLKGCE